MKCLVLLFALLSVVSLMPSTIVFAAPKKTQPVDVRRSETMDIGNWTVNCASGAERDAKWHCSALLRITQKANNTRRVVFTWVIGRRKGKVLSIFSMPSGILIEPGVRVVVHGKQFKKIGFSLCVPNHCEAILSMDKTATEILSKAPRADVLVTAVNGKIVKFTVNMRGFDEALARVSK